MSDDSRFLGAAPPTEASERLRQTQDLLFAIAENTEAVVFCKDLQGRYTFVNQTCVDLWRLARDEIVGKTDFDLFPEDVAEALNEDDRRVVETGESLFLEEEVVFHGQRRVFNASKVPLVDADGAVYAVCGVATEMTEHRLAAEALLEETRRLETLNDLGRTLAGELDRERLVQAVVDAGRDLSGAAFAAFFYTVESDGDELLQLYALSGADVSDFESFGMPRATDIFGPTMRGEAILRIDDVLEDPRYGNNPPHSGMPEGHLPVRSYLAVPVSTRGGDVFGGLFFGHPDVGVFDQAAEDIVASIAAEASVALEAARAYEGTRREIRRRAAIEEELQHANRQKDEFLAVLGHELRNPIGTLQNCVEIMTLLPESDAAARAQGMIGRQLTQLTRLVDDLLDVGRIATGRFRITRGSIDLASVVRTVSDDFADRFENLGLRYSLHLSDRALWVDADRARLGQALGNLLDNAAKYTPRGGAVDVRLEAEEDAALIEVADSGIGFEPGALQNMFEPFQGTGARDGRDGLGLGLAIVREIADRHDAVVEASSEGPNHGATFSLRLPRIDVPTPQAAPDAGRVPRRRIRRRIVVIDDNVSFLESLADVLDAWGHDVLTAGDGPSGIDTVLAGDVDIVLCDIDLGAEMDGYLVARRLRSLDATKELCLVAVTGFGQDADRERALNTGFDAHIVKPIDFHELGRLLEELVPGECKEGSEEACGEGSEGAGGEGSEASE